MPGWQHQAHVAFEADLNCLSPAAHRPLDWLTRGRMLQWQAEDTQEGGNITWNAEAPRQSNMTTSFSGPC